MTRTNALSLVISLVLSACEAPPDPSDTPAVDPAQALPAVPAAPATEASGNTPEPAAPPARDDALASEVTRAEWRRADNRADCAPLVLTGEGGQLGRARRAEFAGGWAVAFDLPGMRSAYGVAGPGLTALDAAQPAEQERRLQTQWPYFRRLDQLPAPAFAGYGLEGALSYPEDDSGGVGAQSLAYVRVGTQHCTYNVWTKLGRVHLKTLLGSLRLLER